MTIKSGKPVIVICAFNEEDNIGSTLDSILSGQPNTFRIIVVDDGSTDKTASIAEERGVEVVRFLEKGKPKNRGKASAFFAGLKAAAKTNPWAVLALDADLTQIRPRDLTKLAMEVHVTPSKSKMAIARVVESTVKVPYAFSGIRAFSPTAVHQLVRSSLKKIPRNYGLEVFLNDFFPAAAITRLTGTGFKAKAAFRKGRKQLQEIADTRRRSTSHSLRHRRRMPGR